VRQRGPDWLRPERGPTDKAPADGDGGLTGVGPGLTPPGALSTRGAGGLFLRRRWACGQAALPKLVLHSFIVTVAFARVVSGNDLSPALGRARLRVAGASTIWKHLTVSICGGA